MYSKHLKCIHLGLMDISYSQLHIFTPSHSWKIPKCEKAIKSSFISTSFHYDQIYQYLFLFSRRKRKIPHKLLWYHSGYRVKITFLGHGSMKCDRCVLDIFLHLLIAQKFFVNARISKESYPPWKEEASQINDTNSRLWDVVEHPTFSLLTLDHHD